MTLSTVPPERFNHLLLALRDALLAMKPASDTAQQGEKRAGVSGVLKLLNDEALAGHPATAGGAGNLRARHAG